MRETIFLMIAVGLAGCGDRGLTLGQGKHDLAVQTEADMTSQAVADMPPRNDLAVPIWSSDGGAHVCDGVRPGGDPRLASVHCDSTDPSNDFVGDLTQTGYESGLFILVFHRTWPTPIDRIGCVTGLYSGHTWYMHDAANTMGIEARADPEPGDVGDSLTAVWLTNGSQVINLVDQATLRCWGAWNYR